MVFLKTERMNTKTRRRQAALILMLLLGFVSLSANGLVSPALSPERVVKDQLEALKNVDMNRAYESYTPGSKEVIGGVDNFVDLITAPPFETLVKHNDAQVLMTTFPNGDSVASCFVKVVLTEYWRKKKFEYIPCLYFWWELSKEEDEFGNENWMVDAFMPDFDDMEFDAIEIMEMDEDEGDLFDTMF
jgi:hypothetical protein